MSYENARGGGRQNVHTKRDWSDEDQREYLKQLDEEKKRKREERKARWGDSYSKVQRERIRFNPKEAAEREKIVKEKIAEKRKMALTKGGKGGIIKSKGYAALANDKVVPELRKESSEWVHLLSDEEIRAVEKYTKNSGDPKDDKFYARLNAMLRGDIPVSSSLTYYSELISTAISKFDLKYDIVCYRSIDTNVYIGYNIGDIIVDPQFISTSVVKSGALINPVKVKIYIPKGSNGAYIEPISKFPRQREFLIDKQSVFKIITLTDDYVELEMIT